VSIRVNLWRASSFYFESAGRKPMATAANCRIWRTKPGRLRAPIAAASQSPRQNDSYFPRERYYGERGISPPLGGLRPESQLSSPLRSG